MEPVILFIGLHVRLNLLKQRLILCDPLAEEVNAQCRLVCVHSSLLIGNAFSPVLLRLGARGGGTGLVACCHLPARNIQGMSEARYAFSVRAL